MARQDLLTITLDLNAGDSAKRLAAELAAAAKAGNAAAAAELEKLRARLGAAERSQNAASEQRVKALADYKQRLAIEGIRSESTRRKAQIEAEYQQERQNIQNLLRQRLDAGEITQREMAKQLAGYEQQLGAVRARALDEVPGRTLGSRAGRLGDALGIGAGAIAGLSAGALGSQIVRIGADFEAAMSKVKAASSSTDADLAALTAQARELGKSTTFSASQAAEGMYELATAGYDAREVMAAMPGVLDAAAAGQMDLARTAEIVVGTLGAFGLGADKAQHVADLLAKAAADASLEIDDIGLSFEYAAPGANMLGLAVEDVGAALMAMSEAQIKGEKAGTALRGGFDALLTPSKDAAALMDQMGLSIETAEGNMKPLALLIGDFNRAMGDMAPVQRAAALSTLVGSEAASGFAQMMKVGEKQLQSYTIALRESGGAADEMATQRVDNLRGDLEQLGGTLEELGITVYSVFQNELRAAAQAGAASLDDLGSTISDTDSLLHRFLSGVISSAEFIREWGDQIVFAAKVAVVYAAATKGVAIAQALANAQVTQAVVSLYRVQVSLGQATLGTTSLTLAQRLQAGATATASAAQQGLNAAMRANPIGLIIGLISAAAAAYLLFRQRADEGTDALRRQEQAALDLATAIRSATGAQLIDVVERGDAALTTARRDEGAARLTMIELVRQSRDKVQSGQRGTGQEMRESPAMAAARAKAESARLQRVRLEKDVEDARARRDRSPEAQRELAVRERRRLVEGEGANENDPRIAALNRRLAAMDARQRAIDAAGTPKANPPATPAATSTRERRGATRERGNDAARDARQREEAERSLAADVAQMRADADADELRRSLETIRLRADAERAALRESAAEASKGATEAQKTAIAASLSAGIEASETRQRADEAAARTATRERIAREADADQQIADERARLNGATETDLLTARGARIEAEIAAEVDSAERRAELERDLARVRIALDRQVADARAAKAEQTEAKIATAKKKAAETAETAAEKARRKLDEEAAAYARLAGAVVDVVEASLGRRERMSEAAQREEGRRFDEQEAALKESLSKREISQAVFTDRMAILAEQRSAFEREREAENMNVFARMAEGTLEIARAAAIDYIKLKLAEAAAAQLPKLFAFAGPLALPLAAASIAGVFGLLSVITRGAGFASGGYTGAGGRYDVAGQVHRGEVVMEAPIVRGQEREWMQVRRMAQRGVTPRQMLDAVQMRAALRPAFRSDAGAAPAARTYDDSALLAATERTTRELATLRRQMAAQPAPTVIVTPGQARIAVDAARRESARRQAAPSSIQIRRRS